MQELKIENGITIPPIRKGGSRANNSYPFADMRIGQSFTLKGPGPKMSKRLSVAAWAFRQTNPDYFFVVRSYAGFARLWRVPKESVHRRGRAYKRRTDSTL